MLKPRYNISKTDKQYTDVYQQNFTSTAETLISSFLKSSFLSGQRQVNSRLPDGFCHAYRAAQPGSSRQHCSFMSLNSISKNVVERMANVC